MTIEFAIKHYNDLADNNNGKCGEDFRQLAEWLTELKEMKESDEYTSGWNEALAKVEKKFDSIMMQGGEDFLRGAEEYKETMIMSTRKLQKRSEEK